MVNWNDIHPEFTEELVQEWKNKEFSYKEAKDWVNVGLKVEDAGFASWLRDTKRVNTEWVLKPWYKQELREEYLAKSEKKEKIEWQIIDNDNDGLKLNIASGPVYNYNEYYSREKGFSLKEDYSPGSNRLSLEELALAQKGQQNQKQVVQILYNPPKGGNH